MKRSATRLRRAFAWAQLPDRGDVFFALGIGLVFAGLWMWARPIALITLGLVFVLLAFRA